jgi:hypothetical protein
MAFYPSQQQIQQQQQQQQVQPIQQQQQQQQDIVSGDQYRYALSNFVCFLRLDSSCVLTNLALLAYCS